MLLENQISNWLRLYLDNNKLESFVIGISGGIDSAVTSALCARTSKKTVVITMPIHQNPSETDRGKKHINWLQNKYCNVTEMHIDLTDTYESLVSSVNKKYHSKLSLANTRARIRMSTLYMIAGSLKGIVVGTGNKVEDFGVGFFTKYGDGGVDISPIADLMKSEVYDLGINLGVIDEIIKAKPTDGLWDDGRTDEDQLGVSYDDLEWAMNYNNDGKNLTKEQRNILRVYKKHRIANIHKMKKIPVFTK
tara:strand:- start:237 stop:983 length:747 start_codon:yes stop_codon:yes gene_type:complete